MSGEKNLDILLKNMSPKKRDGEWVFVTVNSDDIDSDLKESAAMIYKEEEGETLIIAKETADQHGLSFEAVWGLITLNIHSDLQAVGFLAAITNRLAENGISVNAVSAYYHDHLYIPIERVDEVMDLLEF